MPNSRTTGGPEPGTASSGGLVRIKEEEFDAIRRLIYDEVGINLTEGKGELVSSRLAKRLRHFGFGSYGEYYDYLIHQDSDRVERGVMINCITTNKTEFFREPDHFEYLKNTVIPDLRERAARGGQRRLRIWSSASSSGEEPYSLAMTVREHLKPAQGWDVKILASDIDTDVLARAESGIYSEELAEAIPSDLRRKYCLRGTGSHAGKIQVRPEIRQMITFQRVNLVQEPWPLKGRFDVIFCRNVIIYFDRPTQQRLFERFADRLHEDGYLFLGHSESLHWLTDLFAPLGGTVYRPRKGVGGTTPPSPVSEVRASAALREKTIVVGEVFASRSPVIVQTLLGSCVAACLFDPEAKVGGMNHFLLPEGTPTDGKSNRFGAQAMEHLIAEIVRLGGDRNRLRAKVFGGAYLLNLGPSSPDVGRQNAGFVQKFLADRGIPVLSQCLGGNQPLKVRFYTHEGRAQVKPLEGESSDLVAEREARRCLEVAQRLSHREDETSTPDRRPL